jgi:hypothetical protein
MPVRGAVCTRAHPEGMYRKGLVLGQILAERDGVGGHGVLSLPVSRIVLPRMCPECGEGFRARSRRHIYCTAVCCQEARRRGRRAAALRARVERLMAEIRAMEVTGARKAS